MKALKLCLIVGFLGLFFCRPLFPWSANQVQKSTVNDQVEFIAFNFDDKKEKDPTDFSTPSFEPHLVSNHSSQAKVINVSGSQISESGHELSHYLIAFFHTGPPFSPF